VVAKVEWHPGELYPRVGFIVASLARPVEARGRLLQPARHCRAVDQRSEGGDQVDAPCSFAANAVRLQLHALAYTLGNFMRTLAMPAGSGAVVPDEFA
jgi:hypothetical protein